jgi:isoquinoline 1-oxidoreductase beta subunit
MDTQLNRRQFVQGSTAAGLTLYFSVGLGGTTDLNRSRSEIREPHFRPNARLTIDTDGKVVVHIEKAEMGQGVTTAIAQIVAEELDAEWHDVSFALNTYTADHGFVFTASSLSIYTSFDTVSRAAASARMMLVATAAREWGVDAAACAAATSTVSCDSRYLSYGEIVKLRPQVRTLSAKELAAISLKKPSEYSVIGKANPSPHHMAKARGAFTYGIDFTLPGMVYAKVAYPPSRGSQHQSVDDRAARQVPGFVQTVVNKHVVAVVAQNYGAAISGRDALKIVWDDGPNAGVNSEQIEERFKQRIASEDGRPWVKRGDPAAALARAEKTVSQEYATDLVAHLQMEPYNATAEFRDGEMHMYCGTQYPTRLLSQIAERCDLAPEKIFIHGQYMGGGFGALLETEWHAQAAIIAKAIDRPVKLMLSREEDTANDCFRSPTYQKLTCGLSAEQTISGWEHRVVSAWPSTRHSPFLDKKGFDSYALSGSDHHYDISDQHVRAIEDDLGPPVGYVRGVACGYMFFAIESFMDEVAHEAQRDPLEWRLALLEDRPRLKHVLARAADLGEWGRAQPLNTGLGLSAITAQDGSHNTMRIGACVQAQVNPSSGIITVEKVSCVVDCGIAINPNGAMAMAEGALLYGLSIALKGGGTLKHGRIVERNFDAYPVLRMSDVPELEIELVRSTSPATGMGEPTMSCIAPALANAVFAASGARVRSLPMTPERVKSAMSLRETALS